MEGSNNSELNNVGEIESYMSSLDLNFDQSHHIKRNIESLTIEGSPMILNKRMQMRPTPDFASNHRIFADLVPTRSILPSSSCVDIICASSIVHDTKDHQENAQRTLLLDGPSGCLRRESISKLINWIDSDNIMQPSLADLLRLIPSIPQYHFPKQTM